MTDRDPLQISEAELRAMTKQMNEMHAETFPVLHESLGDFGSSLRGKLRGVGAHSANRRTFLIGSGVTLGGALMAACSKSTPKKSSDSPSALSSSSSAESPSGSKAGAESPSGSESAAAGGAGKDIAALSTNASLENLAVFAYMSALAEAPKGKFGKSVPPAVAEFAKHAMAQHKDHAAAFNAALKNAGAKEFTDPNPALAPTVIKLFGAVNDVPGLAQLALTLENTAGATYVKQMGTLTNPDALKAVATIAPVERQHAAILNFVLGNYPVPDVFVKLDEQKGSSASLGARPDTDAGVS